MIDRKNEDRFHQAIEKQGTATKCCGLSAAFGGKSALLARTPLLFDSTEGNLVYEQLPTNPKPKALDERSNYWPGTFG